MADPTLQRVFSRVFTYLAESGLDMDLEQSRALLKLIDDALPGNTDGNGRLNETDLLGQVMDRLPDYFSIRQEPLPTPSPSLLRGSIGYPDRG